MELHERLNTSKPLTGANDPFAEVKSRVHFTVIGDLGPQLYNVNMDPEDLRERVLADVRDQLAQETGISRDDRQRIALEVTDDILGHGPLERLLADESVTEIMVNGPYDIWIERGGRLSPSDVVFNDEWHLRRIVNKMVAQVGRRIDESSPMVDARLPDGSRVNAVIPPLSLSGPLITIRKFSRKRLTLDDMIKLGTLSQETVEFLQRCIQAQLNMLISGGTGSGKTTLLNALSTAIPNEERIVTIEDAAELRLNQDHVLRLESRPKDLAGENEIPIRMLVRNSLRMRPDRIIVGEVRGAEALDMLQAMNTGHDGSLSTIHSNSSARRAIPRRDDGADGRLRPAGARDPRAGLVGARVHHPPRAARGRLPPRHLGHRGAGDGVGGDHAPGAVQVPDRRGDAGRHDRGRPARDGPPAALSSRSSRSAASRCRSACSRRGSRSSVRLRLEGSAGEARRADRCGRAWPHSPPRPAAAGASSGPQRSRGKGACIPRAHLRAHAPNRPQADHPRRPRQRERRAPSPMRRWSRRAEAAKKTFGAVLVLDASYSMTGKPIAAAVAAEQAFVNQLNPNEELGIIEFNQKASVELPLTTSKTKIAAALAKPPQIATGTHIYDAVAKAEAMLNAGDVGSGSILLLSDGADTGSTKTLSQVAQGPRREHEDLHDRPRRPELQAGTLKALAAAGHGEYAKAKAQALAPLFNQLGQQLSNEYLLQYKSLAGPDKPIRVRVSGQGCRNVHYRLPDAGAAGHDNDASDVQTIDREPHRGLGDHDDRARASLRRRDRGAS